MTEDSAPIDTRRRTIAKKASPRPTLVMAVISIILGVSLLFFILARVDTAVLSIQQTQSVIQAQTGPAAQQRSQAAIQAIECRIIVADRQVTIDAINAVLSTAHAHLITPSQLPPIHGCTSNGKPNG